MSWGLFLLFIFLTGTSHDRWKREEERGHLGFVVTDFGVVPLAALARGSCHPQRLCRVSAVAQLTPLYLVPRKSIWLGPLRLLSSASNKSLMLLTLPRVVAISFEEREDRRRGVFALVFPMK